MASISRAPKTAGKCDPAEAARCYVEDEDFAQRFDAELRAEHTRQLQRLARLGRHLQASDDTSAREIGKPPAKSQEPNDRLFRRIEDAVRKADRKGFTRGDLASVIDVDSRDGRLTRALQMLKRDGTLVQRGSRRAARYYLAER